LIKNKKVHIANSFQYKASSSLYEQQNLVRVSINAVQVNENVKEDNANELKTNARAKSSKVSCLFLLIADTNNKKNNRSRISYIMIFYSNNLK